MSEKHTQSHFVEHNHLTDIYETKDGVKIPGIQADIGSIPLINFFYFQKIRDDKRAAIAKATGGSDE